jgi:hypothetical protein
MIMVWEEAIPTSGYPEAVCSMALETETASVHRCLLPRSLTQEGNTGQIPWNLGVSGQSSA